MKALLLSAATLAIATTALAQEETTMTMEEVPTTVMEAATAANTMGVTFDAVAMDEGVYEFSGTMEGGMGYEVDVMEDGTIEEVEEQIEASDLPEAVTAALETNLAGFTPDYVERSTHADGSIVYEFEGTHEGQTIDAEFYEDGSNFMTNEDSAG